MNGRVYDPVLGRFLSADPFVPYPLSTQGFNRYSYANNNPLSFRDFSGFEYGHVSNEARGYAKDVGEDSRDGGGFELLKDVRDVIDAAEKGERYENKYDPDEIVRRHPGNNYLTEHKIRRVDPTHLAIEIVPESWEEPVTTISAAPKLRGHELRGHNT